ncbi:MAG TPA: phosphoribosylformylglycinamidine synthase subunit PurS [Nitrososphaerales archaeon]|nr:phosphoribosylformylglycinamidine synthase subunit PurS [Nitrososphaerales archaeon]
MSVVISNKPGVREPEGETILHDLVTKSGFEQVESIRAGKYLRVKVVAPDPASAKRLVEKMCNELRIFNPAAHSCEVTVGKVPGQ